MLFWLAYRTARQADVVAAGASHLRPPSVR